METSKHTKGLYWLDVKARALRFFGGLIFLGGLICAFSFSFNHKIPIIILSAFLGIIGIFLLIKGSQNDLEFKRKSGYIVYRDN